MSYHVDQVRAQISRAVRRIRPPRWGGRTQAAAPVIDAIAGTLRRAVSNRGTAFEPARRADQIVADARRRSRTWSAAEPDGVVFGASATALTYRVANTLAQDWRPGDEVVVSRLDHDANVRPWVQAAEAAGATVRWAEFDPKTGELPADQYAALVSPGPAWSRSPRPATRSAPSRRSARSPTWPTRPAPWSTSTACTPPRTCPPTSASWARTSTSPAPTSGPARTWPP